MSFNLHNVKQVKKLTPEEEAVIQNMLDGCDPSKQAFQDKVTNTLKKNGIERKDATVKQVHEASEEARLGYWYNKR